MDREKLASRIAKQYFRRVLGDTFQPPPDLLDEVQDFIIQKWTGHVLAVVRDRLERLRSKQQDYGDMVDEVKEAREAAFEDLKDIQVGEEIHYPLRPDEQKGILVGRNEEGYWYTYTKEGRPHGRTYDGYRSYKVRRKVEEKFVEALNTLIPKAREAEEVAKDEGFSYVELTRIEKAASKLAEKPRRYKSTSRTTIPIDLQGWQYIEDSMEDARREIRGRINALRAEKDNLEETLGEAKAEEEPQDIDLSPIRIEGLQLEYDDGTDDDNYFPFFNRVSHVQDDEYKLTYDVSFNDDKEAIIDILEGTAEEAISISEKALQEVSLAEIDRFLASEEFSQIEVVLYFDQHVKRHGQWRYRDRELQVDATSEPHTVEDFYAALDSLKQTARHETQHAGQYLLRDLKGLEELGGLPPGEVRDPKWDEWGRSDGGRYQRDHALRDVEFQTRLSDEIDIFMEVVERIPREARRSAMRVWMVDASEEDREQAEEINRTLGLEGRHKIKGREFFRMLKASEPERWEEAVKTFVDEVQSQVDMS